MSGKKDEGERRWTGTEAARFSYDWEMATKRLLGETEVSKGVLLRWEKEVMEFRTEQAERLAAEKAALKEAVTKSAGRRTSARTGTEA